MSKYWKWALAAGGLFLAWTLLRSSNEGEDSPRSSGEGGSPEPRQEPAASASTEAPASDVAPGPESDGGIVRDGRMRGGTWNFAPSDAPEGAPGCLVLRDVPKSSIKVDEKAVELRGGFRGFRGVPAGGHELELEGYGGAKVTYKVEMPAGGCIVLIYEDSGGPPRLEPDRDWGPQYIGLAMGGAMGNALWPWPGGEEGEGGGEA